MNLKMKIGEGWLRVVKGCYNPSSSQLIDIVMFMLKK